MKPSTPTPCHSRVATTQSPGPTEGLVSRTRVMAPIVGPVLQAEAGWEAGALMYSGADGIQCTREASGDLPGRIKRGSGSRPRAMGGSQD